MKFKESLQESNDNELIKLSQEFHRSIQEIAVESKTGRGSDGLEISFKESGIENLMRFNSTNRGGMFFSFDLYNPESIDQVKNAFMKAFDAFKNKVQEAHDKYDKAASRTKE